MAQAMTEAANREKARQFYRQNTPMKPREIESHLKGIDFSKPVTVGPPPPAPRKMTQWQVPGGSTGSYFSAQPNAPPDRLGIAQAGIDRKTGKVTNKVKTTHNVPEGAPYLKSTAAPMVDPRSVPGRSYSTKGGGEQYFIPSMRKSPQKA